jgi:hypothetical protein
MQGRLSGEPVVTQTTNASPKALSCRDRRASEVGNRMDAGFDDAVAEPPHASRLLDPVFEGEAQVLVQSAHFIGVE